MMQDELHLDLSPVYLRDHLLQGSEVKGLDKVHVSQTYPHDPCYGAWQ